MIIFRQEHCYIGKLTRRLEDLLADLLTDSLVELKSASLRVNGISKYFSSRYSPT